MKTILIVDDQAAVRELVSVTLEIGPYQILEASNGDEALLIAQLHKPDLILLDVQMAGGQLDGLDVCVALKSDPATRLIRIVMLTAKGQEWDKQASFAAGADGYFAKPFSPLDLMHTVEEFLK